MKRIAALALAALVAACGSESGGGKAAAPAAPDSPEASNPESTNNDPRLHSMMIADAGALPPCSTEAEGWLVYVKSEKTFKVCSAGSWLVVDIKGEKGDKGESGASGDPGAAGQAGSKGDKGDPGDDGETFAQNEWIDPVTGLRWFAGGIYNGSPVETFCTGDWRLPSDSEVLDAVKNGLYAAFYDLAQTNAAYNCAVAESGFGSIRVAVKFGATCPTSSGAAALYCVENP